MPFIQDSKYIPETVSVITDFSEFLSAGDYLTGIPSIEVTVASGIDSNPNNILYQGASLVNNATKVSQRVRLGQSGVIYYINVVAQTHLGDTLENGCYLAILTIDGFSIPTWLPLWESTQLYPIETREQYLPGVPTLLGGTLQTIIINYSEGPDEYTSSVGFLGGTLYETVIPYNRDYDAYQSSTTLTAGTLVSVLVSYNNDYDSYKDAVALIAGTLTIVVIPYSLEEQYTSSVALIAGTLT